MSSYYSSNHLNPNPANTQICCSHPMNRDAKRNIDVTWNGLELDHYTNTTYLGVTLDRTLSFKLHALNTKAKINTRNNLLRKLTISRWGPRPPTVRTTALELCFSTAEFACSWWGRSRHTGHVDIALNDTCRIITGCLKATTTPCLYALAGIAPPKGCRQCRSMRPRRWPDTPTPWPTPCQPHASTQKHLSWFNRST